MPHLQFDRLSAGLALHVVEVVAIRTLIYGWLKDNLLFRPSERMGTVARTDHAVSESDVREMNVLQKKWLCHGFHLVLTRDQCPRT